MFDRDDSDEQRGCVAICPMVVRGVLTVGALTVDWDFAISITNPEDLGYLFYINTERCQHLGST